MQQVPFRYAEAEPKPMRVCVVGAGAIGGLMAAKLAGAGHPVTVIDQGAQLAAIRENGLKLVWEDGSEQVAKVKAVESAAEAGPQDLVILAVKAHFLDQVVREIDAMLGARDHDHDRPERAALVVFPEARRRSTTATSSRASIRRASSRARSTRSGCWAASSTRRRR